MIPLVNRSHIKNCLGSACAILGFDLFQRKESRSESNTKKIPSLLIFINHHKLDLLLNIAIQGFVPYLSVGGQLQSFLPILCFPPPPALSPWTPGLRYKICVRFWVPFPPVWVRPRKREQSLRWPTGDVQPWKWINPEVYGDKLFWGTKKSHRTKSTPALPKAMLTWSQNQQQHILVSFTDQGQLE